MKFHDDLFENGGVTGPEWCAIGESWFKSSIVEGYRQDAADLLSEKLADSPLLVLDDQRLCRILPFWFEVLRAMDATSHVVIPFRSPSEIVELSRTRDGTPAPTAVLLWLRRVLDAEFASRGMTRSLVDWNDMCADGLETMDTVCIDTGMSWLRMSDWTAERIADALAADIADGRNDADSPEDLAAVPEWVWRAYRALQELARNPGSNSALQELDQIRGLFDRSCKMFTPIIGDVDGDNLRWQEILHGLDAEYERLRQDFDVISTAGSVLLVMRSESDEDGAPATEDPEDVARERNRLRQIRDELLAEKEAATSLRETLAGQLAGRQQALAQAQRRSVALQQRANRAERSLAEAHAREMAQAAQTIEREASLTAAVRQSAKMSERVRIAEQALTEAKDRERALADDLAAREAVVAELTKSSAALSERAERAERALAQTRDREAEAQARENELAERLTAREAALTELAKNVAALDQKLKERDAKLAEVERRSTALAEQVVRAEGALGAAKAHEAALSEKLIEREAALAELANRSTSLSEQVARAQQALEQARTREAALAGQLLEREAALAEVAPRSAALSERVAHVEQALHDAQTRETALAGQLLEREAALAEVTHRSSALSEQFAHVESALTEAKTRENALHDKLVDNEAMLAFAEKSLKKKSSGIGSIFAHGTSGDAKKLLKSGLFDIDFYVKNHKDINSSGIHAIQHYIDTGFKHGFNPNELFDTHYYIKTYEDVRHSGINPLIHYCECGWKEGRDPGPGFQTAYYLDANPDVRAAGINPLLHYLRYGRDEGRPPKRPE